MIAPHPHRCETCTKNECWYKECEIPDDEISDFILHFGCASHSTASNGDVQLLKDAIIEVLDTGFESSERDVILVLDRIDAWVKGELRTQEQP